MRRGALRAVRPREAGWSGLPSNLRTSQRVLVDVGEQPAGRLAVEAGRGHQHVALLDLAAARPCGSYSPQSSHRSEGGNAWRPEPGRQAVDASCAAGSCCGRLDVEVLPGQQAQQGERRRPRRSRRARRPEQRQRQQVARWPARPWRSADRPGSGAPRARASSVACRPQTSPATSRPFTGSSTAQPPGREQRGAGAQRLHDQVRRQQRRLPQVAALALAEQERRVDGGARRQPARSTRGPARRPGERQPAERVEQVAATAAPP